MLARMEQEIEFVEEQIGPTRPSACGPSSGLQDAPPPTLQLGSIASLDEFEPRGGLTQWSQCPLVVDRL